MTPTYRQFGQDLFGDGTFGGYGTTVGPSTRRRKTRGFSDLHMGRTARKEPRRVTYDYYRR